MKLLSYDGSTFSISLTKDELIVAVGALNEVCNGIHIDDWDFETRLGISKTEARVFLKELSRIASSKPEA